MRHFLHYYPKTAAYLAVLVTLTFVLQIMELMNR